MISRCVPPFDRLIVAGTPKATSQLVRLLPKRLRGKLVGTVGMSVGTSQNGGKAVAGFASVLDAVNQGRVWKLFYAKGLKKVGGECSECNAYAPDPTGPCTYCGGDVRRLPQCVDRLTQSVMEMGGQVEVIDGPAAEHLKPHGSIAALLRY